MLYQGDQYYLPIVVRDSDKNIIIPEDFQGMKVQIGNQVYKYPDDIIWDSVDQKYYLPVTQDTTLELSRSYSMQVQINFGPQSIGTNDVIITSRVLTRTIGESIIKKKWNEETV